MLNPRSRLLCLAGLVVSARESDDDSSGNLRSRDLATWRVPGEMG